MGKGALSGRKKIGLKFDHWGYIFLFDFYRIYDPKTEGRCFYQWKFEGEHSMSGLDNLIAFIDNGGTRSGAERRSSDEIQYKPERRIRYDRRSGADRRRALNKKRAKGKERRTVFVEWSFLWLRNLPAIIKIHPLIPIKPQGIDRPRLHPMVGLRLL